jgi:Domain of unknown function (DUF1707)
MAQMQELRIGDAEREAAANSLRDHYAQGRLTMEEFNERLDAIFAAKTHSQLGEVFRDLPGAIRPASPPLPVAATPSYAGNRQQYYRSGRCGAGRGSFGFAAFVLSVFASWLILVDLITPHLRVFPWPGKLAIFLGIFAMIRTLIRKIFILIRGRR